MKKLLILSLLLMTVCAAAYGATITVDPSGQGDFDSLTAALAAAQDGDELILAGGVYDQSRETFPIMVEKRLSIKAREGETPVISAPAEIPAMKITADGTQVHGLQVDFLRSGIWVLGEDIAITRCSLKLADEAWRTSSCGMWVASAKRMTLRDCTFTGCGIAMAGPPISDSSLGLPVLTGMFEVGEDIEYFTTHTVENNLVNGKPLQYVVGLKDAVFSETSGQLIAVQCENVTFTGLDTSRASIGIELAYCKNTVVDQCISDDAGIFGIYVAKTDDSVIQNSRADRGAHGIDLRAINRCVVYNCSSSGSGQGMFFSHAFDSLLSHCKIIENGTGFFASAGNHNQMDHCLIEGNQLGIYIQKEPNFTVTHTDFRANWNTGCRATHADGFVCHGCTFEDNWVAAMGLYSDGMLYQDNSYADSRNTSFYMENVQNAHLIDNVFTPEDKALEQIINCENVLNWE